MKPFVYILFFALLLPVHPSHAFLNHFRHLGKAVNALPEKEIRRLAGLIENTGDVTRVGKEIGKMNLSDNVRADTFMRMLVVKDRIPRDHADEIFINLRGVDGFSSTLKKSLGVNQAGAMGHVNEIYIANASVNHGFKVSAIGKRFNDGVKKADTDIDIIIKKGHREFAIEAKNYHPGGFPIILDKFRADMDSLVAYKNGHDYIIPAFTITHAPQDKFVKYTLQKMADKRGIELIYGDPEAQAIQFEHLEKILP